MPNSPFAASHALIIENYRRLLDQHGSGPAVGQWSLNGQQFRFEKLSEVGCLTGQRVLDVGCGLGDLYPFLRLLCSGHRETILSR